MTDAAVTPARLGALRHLSLGAFWLGTYFVITPVYTIFLQVQVSQTVARPIQSTATGLATGLAGLFAMVLPPLVGFVSDRLHSPWGRRKPIIVAGASGIAVALLVLMGARSYPTVLLGFILAVAFLNTAGAAYVAVIPDTVHPGESGRASGVLGLMVQAGSVLSLLTTLFFIRIGHLRLTYLVLIAVMLLTLVPSLWAMGGSETKRPVARAPGSLRSFLSPLWTGDFAWAFFTRFLTISGLYTILPFLLFAFRDLLHLRRPAGFTTLFELCLTGVAIPVAMICGYLSDRFGRKRFVYASGAVSIFVLASFAIFQSLPQPVVLVLGMLYGVGFGAYTAVDWALALDTLPDKENPAKDMGLFHVADALPRVMIPLFAGALLDTFNAAAPLAGYRAIFIAAICLNFGGAFFVSRIKSVR